MMKKLTIVLACLSIVGCGAIISTVSLKHHELAAKAPPPAAPLPPPPPAPPPPPVPESYSEEEHAIYQAIRVPAKKQQKQTNYLRVPTIEEATNQVTSQLFDTSTGIVSKTQANINETIILSLVIDPTRDKVELKQSLESENPNQYIVTGETKISSRAWPVLIAPDFIVEPVVAAEQAVTQDSATTWTWQLKPKAGGNFNVIVELYAIVYVGDTQTKKKYKTLTQSISITVPPEPWYQKLWNWLDGKWEWFWSGILIPVVLFLWRKFFKKKKKR